MKRFALFMLVLAFCTHCSIGCSPSTIEEVGQTKASATAAQQQTRTGIALRATIDPQTGEFISPAEQETPTAGNSIQPSAFSISAETMEETSSPVPGGGVMIDLKGRFQSPVSATVERNGKTTVEHPDSDRVE
ncbi:hypothetical protein [Desulfosarcina sp.]|uniref:hypothetical protein n=1 Tax=Desulfosarcina sp. TaxID=2027861 RepID=UPI003568D623